MSSVKELKSDTNVILKLNLGEKGGIRRIRLSKIWNNDCDCVDYQKLKNVILELDSTPTTTNSRKEVIVTYKDEDDDMITISTNEELSDAFLQFVNKVPPILRATATTNNTNNQTRRNNDPLPPPPPQVIKLVDAIHDAVSNALDTAWPPRRNSKTQSTSNNNTSTTPTPTPTPTSTSTTLHEQADTMAKKVVSNLKPENLSTHSSTTKHSNNNNNNNNNNKNENDNKSSSHNHTNKKQKEEEPISSKKESQSEVDWNKFDDSFIHGRHTCDACLITPIVGIRYHAKNIVDYDLCQKCVTKASNQDVNFEPAQLERDVIFQERWRRRQQRLELQQKQRLNFLDQNKNQTNEEEENIKEAIRLSLLSSNTPNQDTNKQNATKDSNQDTFPKELQAVVASLKPAHEDHDTNNTTTDSPSLKNNIKQASDTHKTTTTETQTTNHKDMTHKMEKMVDTTILVMEQPNVISPMKQTNDDKATKEVQTSTSKSCDETNYSDSSFAMDAEGSGDVAVAIGQTLDKCAEEINAIVSEIGKSSSSSSDAMSSSFTSFDSALQNHCDDTHKNDKTNAADNHSTAGETILESVQDNDTKTKQEIDDESWQVLENSQNIQDEMVARAASLLGSILFTSEISQESTNDSKNDHEQQQQQQQPFESFLSTESSVPSSVPSMESDISVTVLSRWDVELKQLHEFGFLDDLKNVQVLEKLEAANIGSDCPEHVTVSQAIGELLDGTNQEK